MCLMRYNPTAEYVPGKTLTVADTLSRQPLPFIHSEVCELICDVSAFEAAAHAAWPVSQLKLDRIKQETSMDRELRVVSRQVIEGWPKHVNNIPAHARDRKSVV